MKKVNVRIITGIALLVLGSLILIYDFAAVVGAQNAVVEQLRQDRIHDSYWVTDMASFYLLAGIILLGAGAVVFVSGNRAAQKKKDLL